MSGTVQSVNLGALPAGFHDYLIQPVAGGIQFSVDGVVLDDHQSHHSQWNAAGDRHVVVQRRATTSTAS